ncbi:hypothetical protein A0H76_1707 [Hepatospora eriocheir]|uniref:Uncharacterized protein n=1 Tax=Hepatospora eriocheir TaxID=1081669 RepID=A0A1X0QGN2_9MICR|nr:hypothetical protein A0H76_1707 [Hepatospora eriocheir]
MQMTSDFGLKLNASIEGESENAISHTFKNCYKSLDDELVKKLLKDATLYAEEDKEIEAKFKVKSEFESYLEIYKKRVESVKFNGKENVVHRAYVDTHRDFLLQDKKADSSLTSDRLKEELESLKKNLEEFEKLAQESGDKVETDEKKDSDDRRKVEL